MDPLAEIWNRHGQAVRRFAQHLTGDSSRADDLTQEAFVRLWTTSSPIRTETVLAYLFVIVRNLHRRSFKDASRTSTIIGDVADRAAGPHDQAEQREEARRLRGALAALDEDDRAALLMRVDGELSYEDIGQALGIAAGAARVRVHRARRRLLTAFETREASS